MKYLQTAASIFGSVTAVAALAQGGPIQPCTYTTTSCLTLNDGTATRTIYEVPFTATATSTYDCQGCADVTVLTKACFGVGPVDLHSTTVFEPEQTITTAVCSPTPN
ncbi:hypothetical protein BDR22DRAFT_891303 [Usnea florida]